MLSELNERVRVHIVHGARRYGAFGSMLSSDWRYIFQKR